MFCSQQQQKIEPSTIVEHPTFKYIYQRVRTVCAIPLYGILYISYMDIIIYVIYGNRMQYCALYTVHSNTLVDHCNKYTIVEIMFFIVIYYNMTFQCIHLIVYSQNIVLFIQVVIYVQLIIHSLNYEPLYTVQCTLQSITVI